MDFAGFKRYHQEGGIRVPFILSWPDRLEGGKTYDAPVISLDNPHEYLYWRSGPTQAIRDERWKLIKYKRTDVTGLLEPPAAGWPTDAPLGLVTLLYDLQNDPGETTNVANRYPEIVEGLEAEFAEWNAQLPPPSEAILSAIRSAIIQVDGERVQLIY